MSFYDRNTYNREDRMECQAQKYSTNKFCRECGCNLVIDTKTRRIYCEECERREQEEEDNNARDGA